MTAQQIQEIDPNTLLVDTNVRSDTSLDKDFVASIREYGVLVPIVAVQTAEGGVRVRYGHRRTLAAIAAARATVPVLVTGEDDADEAARIVRQWAENEHRTGLSTADKVAAVEQLSLLGLSAATIAKRTKTSKADVAHAIAAAASPLAKGAAGRYEFVTLDQAAAVAEFEDEPETVKALILAAKEGDGRFAHAAQRARDERQRAQERQAVTDELNAAGVAVIDRPSWEDRSIKGLSELVDPDGKKLTPAAHAQCPGHAAYVDSGWRSAQPVYVCTQWKTQGHRDPNKAGTATPLPEEAREQRRQVIANNKAWKSAETVRREFLTGLLARKTPPKGAASYVATELAHGAHAMRKAMERSPELAATLLGADAATAQSSVAALAETATDTRAQVITLALVLAGYEAETGPHTWRNPSEEVRRYFGFLLANGYELSDVEQQCVTPTPKRRRRTA